MPPAGYQGPPVVDETGLEVRLRLEDDPALVLDLRSWPGSTRLRQQVGRAFVSWSTSNEVDNSGRRRALRRKATLRSATQAVRAWLRWIETLNGGGRGSAVQSMDDLTVFHARLWRSYLAATYSQSCQTNYGTNMRSIFRNTPEIPQLVRVKLLARDPNSRRWPSQALTRRVEPYPRGLVEALRSAA